MQQKHENFATTVLNKDLKGDILDELETDLKELLIIADSSLDIPTSWSTNIDLKIVKVPIFINQKEYKGLNGENNSQEFYDSMQNDRGFIPKISKVSVHDFYEAMSFGLENYKNIVCLPMSRHLSATYESALQAWEMVLKNPRITVVDTLTMSGGLGILVKFIADRHTQAEKLQKTLDMLLELIKDLQIYLVVDDLKYLQQSGKLGKNKSLLSKLFKIEPLLILQDGKIQETGQRVLFSHESKKIELLFNKIKESNQNSPIQKLLICFAGKSLRVLARNLVEKCIKDLNIASEHVDMVEMSIVTGGQTGLGTIVAVLV
jgi:DegV family protein with EDD domain